MPNEYTVVSVIFVILFIIVWLTVPALYGATVIFVVHYLWHAWLTIQPLYEVTVIFAVSLFVAWLTVPA